jgi:MFS family permease
VDFPGSGRWAAASLIDALGSGLLIPLSVLFFTQHVGLSPGSVGAGLTIGGLIALAFVPLAGLVIDGLGPRRALVAYWILAAGAYAAYGLVGTWAEFVLAVTFAEIASAAASTASKALLAELATGDERVALMASRRSLRNLGYGVGSLLSAAALAIGGGAFLVVVYTNAASYLVAIGLVAGLPVRAPHPEASGVRAADGLRRVLRDRRYLALTGLDLLVDFNATALEVAVPLWVVLHTHAPRAVAGVLFTVNTAMVVLAQVRLTAGVRGLADAPRAYRRAAVTMVLSAAAYLAAHSVGEIPAIGLLIVGVVAHTSAEMFASAGQWTVSIDLADERHRGQYLAVFSLGAALEGAIGPVVVTSLLRLGTVWLWPALALVIATGALLTGALARRAAPA